MSTQREINIAFLSSLRAILKILQDAGYKYDANSPVKHDFQRIAKKVNDCIEDLRSIISP